MAFAPGVVRPDESLYGKARRIWVMDRGIPTEEVLSQMTLPEQSPPRLNTKQELQM
jgi:hypothetical protein